MKRKFCIMACFLFILGFSGIANAGNWDIQKLNRSVFLMMAYSNHAPVDRHLTSADREFGNKFIPHLHAIKKTYLEQWLKHHERDGLWDGIERPPVVDREKALGHILSQLFDVGSKQIISNSVGNAPSVSPVPEPGTILLMGIGLVGLAGYGRRKIIKL